MVFLKDSFKEMLVKAVSGINRPARCEGRLAPGSDLRGLARLKRGRRPRTAWETLSSSFPSGRTSGREVARRMRTESGRLTGIVVSPPHGKVYRGLLGQRERGVGLARCRAVGGADRIEVVPWCGAPRAAPQGGDGSVRRASQAAGSAPARPSARRRERWRWRGGVPVFEAGKRLPRDNSDQSSAFAPASMIETMVSRTCTANFINSGGSFAPLITLSRSRVISHGFPASSSIRVMRHGR